MLYKFTIIIQEKDLSHNIALTFDISVLMIKDRVDRRHNKNTVSTTHCQQAFLSLLADAELYFVLDISLNSTYPDTFILLSWTKSRAQITTQ